MRIDVKIMQIILYQKYIKRLVTDQVPEIRILSDEMGLRQVMGSKSTNMSEIVQLA